MQFNSDITYKGETAMKLNKIKEFFYPKDDEMSGAIKSSTPINFNIWKMCFAVGLNSQILDVEVDKNYPESFNIPRTVMQAMNYYYDLCCLLETSLSENELTTIELQNILKYDNPSSFKKAKPYIDSVVLKGCNNILNIIDNTDLDIIDKISEIHNVLKK